MIGLAASCGHDTLRVRRAPRAALLVFGDELLTAGPPGAGRVRDALGPAVPGWLRRYGCQIDPSDVVGPVADTLRRARRRAAPGARPAPTWSAPPAAPCTARSTTCIRRWRRSAPTTWSTPSRSGPGFPMLLARVAGADGRARFVAGLPGNPQSAIVALVVAGRPAARRPAGPAAAGAAAGHAGRAGARSGRPHPPGAGPAGPGRPAPRPPVRHVGSAMLRGLAGADGFAVIGPGTTRRAGRPGAARAAAAAARGACHDPDDRSITRRRRSPTEPLDLAAHEAAVADRRAGAVVSFQGVVRDHDHGRAVTSLEYEGHPSAGQVLREVAAEIAADPDVYAVAVSHRVGAAGDRRRGPGRGGEHRAPGGGVRGLRPAGRRGEGAAADLEAAGLRRRHRGVGQLPLTGSRPAVDQATAARPSRSA